MRRLVVPRPLSLRWYWPDQVPGVGGPDTTSQLHAPPAGPAIRVFW